MTQSRISVVITCYAEGKLLLEAIDSVLAQTLSALEILVVNDSSSDAETIAACQQLEANSRIQVIWREKNGGTSVARNCGFQAAEGEILVPLDADDLLPPKALEIIQAAFDRYPNAAFIYGSYLRQNELQAEAELVSPGEITLQAMLKAKRFSLSSQWKLIGTTPLRRSLWDVIGGYDPEFGVADLHDVEFWLRAIASGCAYYAVPEPIYVWRKYLGKNSRKVTPISWYRVAEKHIEIYQRLGLDYRAYELLLLGSKWLKNSQEVRYYSSKLIKCISQGRFQLSSLIALVIPAFCLHFFAEFLRKNR
ncbi:MAG TPA: glycosyltransferase [Thermosynechococcaceae cyanobacterium]